MENCSLFEGGEEERIFWIASASYSLCNPFPGDNFPLFSRWICASISQIFHEKYNSNISICRVLLAGSFNSRPSSERRGQSGSHGKEGSALCRVTFLSISYFFSSDSYFKIPENTFEIHLFTFLFTKCTSGRGKKEAK